MSYDTYRDRVLGCWLGKCVAGTLGAPYEGWKGEMDLAWDPAAVACTAPNDDLDLQVVWLDVLERVGVEPTSDDLAEAFDRCCPYDPGEYGVFRRNWRRGIHAPDSGRFNNRYYADGMGCPIRSEIWACIAPGRPDLAVAYAARDGILDHAGESVAFECYLAAVEAAVLAGAAVDAALDEQRRHLPPGSRARRLVDDVLAWSAAIGDWRRVRRLILRDYGHPDCTNAFQNIGITLLALVHGRGDFIATAMLALNCGYDTDCTCATAGAILGAHLGAAELQRRHAFPDAGFRLGVRVERRSDRLVDLAEDTCRVGLAVAERFADCRFAGAPPAPALPRRPPQPVMRVDYGGDPVLAPGERRRLTFHVANPGPAIDAGLSLAGLPAGWTAERTAWRLALAAGASMAVPLDLELAADLAELAECNHLMLDLRWEGGAVRHRFGINGAQLWRVGCPAWLQHAEMPRLRLGESYYPHIAVAPGENRTDRVRQVHLNQRTAVDLAAPIDGDARVVAIREDRFAVEDLLGCQGPCVVELERLLTSPVEREAHLCIGHSDAYALWLDDVLLDRQEGVDWWTAENRHIGPVRLRAGANRLRLRLVRRSHSAWFSLIWMLGPTMAGQLHDLGSRMPS